MGRSFELSLSHASRARQLLAPTSRLSSIRIRILAIILLLGFLHQRHRFVVYRTELRAKYSPTVFAASHLSPWQADREDSDFPQNLLAHRKEWNVLGSGWEGKTFAFNDSVIKTFTPGRSPFRNCAPGAATERWPAEIPASLELGGIWKDGKPPTNTSIAGILPVKAHFLAASSSKSIPEWHLVTPLLPSGNLNNLAKKLRSQAPYKHFRDVDAAYRPVFERLLRTLDNLHSRGFCHDDIKPSNIFVEDDTHWILGDLGNVRHITHPYHSSRLWVNDNDQFPDCRANDVLRALKSYVQFVRAASNDAHVFDLTFFDGRETLSRLFWWTSADAASMSAHELRIRSEVEDPQQASRDDAETYHPRFRGRSTHFHAVDKALETKFSERAARWAALTWIFGVPVDNCS